MNLLNRIDHLVYAVNNLEKGVEEMETLLGVRASVGGRHPKFGTKNCLISLGPECFLEIIGPDPDNTDVTDIQIFGMNQLKSSQLKTWAAKESDLKGRMEKLEAIGVDFGGILPGQREKPDGQILSWHLSNPFLMLHGGIIPFLIDWGNTPNPGQTATQGCTLLDLQIEHPTPSIIQPIFQALDLEIEILQATKVSLIATILSPKGEVQLR